MTSAEPRRDRTSPHTMFKTLLGASGAEALPGVDREYWSSVQILAEIGPHVIAEQLATGRLPVEVALMYEVPILHFRRWMRENMDEDLIEEVRSAAAESLQVKAMLTLSAELKNPAEASQAKALSDRYAKISEALSPKEWNPARVEVQSDIPSVSININGMSMSISGVPPVATGQNHVIDGEVPDLVTSDQASEGGRTRRSAPLTPLSPSSPPPFLGSGADASGTARTDETEYEFIPPRIPTTEEVLERVDPFAKAMPQRSMSEGM